jgi:hypothetical protein
LQKLLDAIHGSSAIAINDRLVVYAAEQGSIRVLHIDSKRSKSLQAPMGQTISDLQVFSDNDLLASVGYEGRNDGTIRGGNGLVVLSMIIECATGGIDSRQLLEIRSEVSCLTRVIWHPSFGAQFLIHINPPSGGTSAATASLGSNGRRPW